MSFVGTALAEPAPEPFIVGAPFDSDPAADVVLRSSDDFEFRVRKAILSLGSPVFNDIFGIPQPELKEEINISAPHNLKASLPCIQLTETGPVVDILLRQCYPLPPPFALDDLDTVFAVRLASDKYDMPFIRANMDKYMKESHSNYARYIIFCYRSACEHHSAAQARQFSWDCLKFPLATILKLWKPVPSSDKALSNLVDYHYTVSLRIGKYISNFNNIMKAGSDMWRYCGTCNTDINGSLRGPKWWSKYLPSELLRIYEEGPISGRILNIPPVIFRPPRKQIGYTFVTATPPEQILNGLCSTCEVSVLKNWAVFITELNINIEEEAKKVRLNPTSNLIDWLLGKIYFALPWGLGHDVRLFMNVKQYLACT